MCLCCADWLDQRMGGEGLEGSAEDRWTTQAGHAQTQTHSRLAHRMKSRQGPGHSTAVANQDPGVGVCGTVGGRRWSGQCRLDVFQLVLTLNSVF